MSCLSKPLFLISESIRQPFQRVKEFSFIYAGVEVARHLRWMGTSAGGSKSTNLVKMWKVRGLWLLVLLAVQINAEGETTFMNFCFFIFFMTFFTDIKRFLDNFDSLKATQRSYLYTTDTRNVQCTINIQVQDKWNHDDQVNKVSGQLTEQCIMTTTIRQSGREIIISTNPLRSPLARTEYPKQYYQFADLNQLIAYSENVL